MGTSDAPALSLNACISCKSGKRKCNRQRPTCSTCARVGRTCNYEEDSANYLQGSVTFRSQSYPATSNDGGFMPSHASSNSGYGYSPERSFNSPAVSVDPFRHEALRQPTVTVAISTEATRIIGTPEGFQTMASKYFEGPGCRLPIISQVRFFERLPAVLSNPHADFILLCLSMHLLSQPPAMPGQNMQSTLYVSVKSHISLLEATSFLSLEVIQARLLITFYEMGHGIHPAATVSIAACAQMSRLLGLNKKKFQSPDDGYAAKIVAEEEKRVWWAVVNLDRYINLLNGDSLFHTEDPQAEDHLPMDGTLWAQNTIPDTAPLSLTTPSNILVGPFARECQISHLIGRVLRHVFEPSSDPDFHLQEALQLERTLMAFMPLLIEEQTKFQYYCAALGMCSSALFILYESTLLSNKTTNSPAYQSSLHDSIETTSTRISEFSRHLFGDPDAVDFDTTSPVVIHSLYQAAVVQLTIWREKGEIRNKNSFEGLKTVLGYFNRRWSTAGKYLEVLENIKEEVPCTMLPVHGSYVSANAPGR